MTTGKAKISALQIQLWRGGEGEAVGSAVTPQT